MTDNHYDGVFFFENSALYWLTNIINLGQNYGKKNYQSVQLDELEYVPNY
jgi:hypothetical protein